MARKTPVQKSEIEIGHRLAMAREQLLISKTKFAIELGITREQLYNYETGRTPLPWDVGLYVCNVFNVNPYWLATGKAETFLKFGFGDDRNLSTRILFSEGVRTLPDEQIKYCLESAGELTAAQSVRPKAEGKTLRQKNRISKQGPESPTPRAVSAQNPSATSAIAAPLTKDFEDYLRFLRQCREEAERLSGGDAAKVHQIFDRLLATWLSASSSEHVKQEGLAPARSSPVAMQSVNKATSNKPR